MEIYIAADHNGYKMKNELRDWLMSQGHRVTDMGPDSYEKGDDYPDYGIKVARAVTLRQAQGEQAMGVLLCGSGVGMAVVADKVKGIRAALIHDPEIASRAQRDDDINVLALGATYIDLEQAKEVVGEWLSTSFSNEERHVRRIGKIKKYEEEHSCSCEECG